MDLRSPSQAEHLEVLADIFGRTFTTYWQRRAFVLDGYIAQSNYDWDSSRIGVIDGEVSTHFGVWDLTMRIGISRVRVAGIGAVATLESHRGKGLMAQTASDCISGLPTAGYDVSLLFGIPNFYHRFGYEVCFSDRSVFLTTRDIKPAEEPIAVERFTGDVAELAELYNQENETVTGTYVRPTFRLNRKPKQFAIDRWADGYVISGREGDTMQVADCAGDPATVVEVARARAASDLCTQIEFVKIPPRSRTGEYLQTISHRSQISRSANGGPMIAINDLRGTLHKVSDELSRRLASSAISGYTGTIAVRTGSQEAILDINTGTVSVAEGDGTLSGSIDARSGLGRLIIGDGDPQRICLQDGVELSGDARYLVPILFPDQEPSTILWDRF